jgi:hypothetical protein
MAKLYRIRGWADIFENNRSKAITDLRWVPIPNRHDGETFSLIMRHKDGATIFAAWILLLQIASKCKPRGTLIRGNGQPHNVSSMSAKCRCPDVWFETGISYLETETDWLIVEELTPERQSDVTPTSGERQLGALKEGRNGREEKEDLTTPPVVPEWVGQLIENCRADGADYTQSEARSAFLALEGNAWKYGQGDKRSALMRQIDFDRSRKGSSANGAFPEQKKRA